MAKISTETDSEEKKQEFAFYPPLYRQRYNKTVQLIEFYGKGSFSKVVDVGCSELGLFPYLKRVEGIKDIVLLDIEYAVLKNYCHKVNPFTIDSILKRNEPLIVQLLCADARVAHSPTLNADVVTMIEFIEHLVETDLLPVVRIVFEVISPSLVIISTPNYDFNRFFPGLPQGKFRHFDHKFEWTQNEFETWCKNVTEDFTNYEVVFTGCGEGPVKDVFCSQIGVFRKKKPPSADLPALKMIKELKVSQPPKLEKYVEETNKLSSNPCCGCLTSGKCNDVYRFEYPYDTRTEEERFSGRVAAGIEQIRQWLIGRLSTWNRDESFIEVTLDRMNFPWQSAREKISNIEEDFAPFEHLGKKTLHAKIKKFSSSNSCELSGSNSNFAESSLSLSSDDAMNNSPVKKTDLRSSEPESMKSTSKKFSLKMVPDEESLKKGTEVEDVARTFFYSEADDSFYFTPETYCEWSGLKPEGVVRNALKKLGWMGKESNLSHLVYLPLSNDSSATEEDLDREGPLT